ncbi:multidrug efflux system membrane fusion protein [Halospina denitrificans]|uniref:Multidrug efflux system membrane fusion protein n=1 Tax=Halospina denitrificans TaxID=332522 RepID=A0A4R7JST4_9GAMM|nr:efflux RND transporter periplasmic adaptor subunit [Halospina denitrificans]TDT41352.1 multidrug efflux system membrane fusion protein [Halospina denitrificans]
METPEKRSLSHHRSALIAGLIFIAAALWMLSGLFSAPDSHNSGETGAKQADEPASVRVFESRHQLIQDRVIITGRTLADRSVAVKAETDGVVEKLHFERGNRVAQGDLLVELAIESRQARLQEARSLVEQREIEFRAAQQLRRQDSIAETSLASARAALEAARAQLEMAVSEAERTRIRSPIEGLIETRDVEQGDFMSRGAPVATVVDLNPIRVKGSLSERHLNRIEIGSRAEVRLINGSVHEGEVAFVGRVAEAGTRTFPVEVVIENDDRAIIEGLTAEVTLFADELAAHRVPSSMLTLADDGTLGVKGVNGAGEVVFYPVEVVRDTSDGVWLTGLPESARLIAVGHEFVSVGQPVQTVPYEGFETPGDSG